MKNWLLGVLTGIVLCFFLLLFFAGLGWYLQSRVPGVASGTTLILKLSGDLPEQVAPDLSGQLLAERQPITFLSLIQDIERAASDERITGILLKPSRLSMGWGKLEQLRQSLAEFQARGKQLTAALSVAGTPEYFVASAARRVYLSPAGILDVKGMRAEVMLFKDSLAKLGIQADLEQIGKYKNFADQFTQSQMSDAFREATTSLLDSIYGHFLQTVAEARQKPLEEMRALIEQSGPFDAAQAADAGLVDQLLYEDEILKQLEAGSGGAFHTMAMEDYHRAPPADGGWTAGQRIAVVYAVGDIIAGEDHISPLSGKTLGSETMAETLETVGEDDSIKGVVVRIDSPGGDAFASDDIWRRMNRLSEKKPLVFSMSDVAASGGYYLAMTGDPIVAEPGTITGSIGIVYGKLNLKGLYDKLGIHKEVIARGEYSRLDSDYGPYTPAERERVRQLMNRFYQDFLSKVAAARNMTAEEVEAVAQGRVWTGAQAQANGLVDELGGFPRALALLKEKAGIPPEERVQLVEFPPRKTLWELLLSRAQRGEIRLPAALAELFGSWAQIEAMSQQPLWAWLPAAFEFR
ncbi:MAG TPA: signal peptide peptidase SppA [Terriglobia bacterium]|nr:signal peptide peptidase SppA [Terriglobia bacterium]